MTTYFVWLHGTGECKWIEVTEEHDGELFTAEGKSFAKEHPAYGCFDNLHALNCYRSRYLALQLHQAYCLYQQRKAQWHEAKKDPFDQSLLYPDPISLFLPETIPSDFDANVEEEIDAIGRGHAIELARLRQELREMTVPHQSPRLSLRQTLRNWWRSR